MKLCDNLSCIKFEIKNFDLEQTLNCGQCFRWKKTEDGSFIGAALGYDAVIYQNGDEITVYADAYAKYVEIDSPDSDFVLSDNYFDMNAGKKTVKIIRGTPKTIKVRSVYDIR